MHPPAEQFALVQRLEAVGFDSVWTGDHLSFHNPLYESLALLGSYASITSRIPRGRRVSLLALRSPAVAAKAAATVELVCRLLREKKRRRTTPGAVRPAAP